VVAPQTNMTMEMAIVILVAVAPVVGIMDIVHLAIQERFSVVLLAIPAVVDAQPAPHQPRTAQAVILTGFWSEQPAMPAVATVQPAAQQPQHV